MFPIAKLRKSPKKCFEIKPEFRSKFPSKKPREKHCSSYGKFDSCLSLQAQVLNDTTRKVVEIVEWKDCATNSRDCHAIKNRCAVMQELAKSQGAHVENCIVNCCDDGDMCNLFSPTASPPGNQVGIKANRASALCEISVLITFLVATVPGMLNV